MHMVVAVLLLKRQFVEAKREVARSSETSGAFCICVVVVVVK